MLRELTLMGSLKHIDLEGYSWPFWLGSFLIWFSLAISICGAGASFLVDAIKAFIKNVPADISVAQVPHYIDNDESDVTSNPNTAQKKDKENYFFEKHLWEAVSEEKIDYELKNNGFYLQDGEVSAQLKYRVPVEFGKQLNFKIIPLNSSALNFSIIRNDMYEITVGDNDMRTVSLKASQHKDEVMKYVAEEGLKGSTTTNEFRPSLKESLNLEKEVLITVNEEVTQSGVRLRISLQYPSQEGNFTSQDFEYNFGPIARWEKLKSLSLGLLKGSAIGRVGVTIVQPEIDLNSI